MQNSKIQPTEDEDSGLLAEQETSVLIPDALMEEINVLRVEGRYFCFDKREAGRRKERRYEYNTRAGGKIVIDLGDKGHPSILAYKLLQTIFHEITEEGLPYPSRVVFTRYKLAKLIGRKTFNNKDGDDIYDALRQLQDTFITFEGTFEGGVEIEDRFNLLSRVTIIRDPTEVAQVSSRSINAVAVRINEAIMDSIAKGHIAIFNWSVLEKLEPLQSALYKRLYFHLSNVFEMSGKNKENLVFKKDYAAICAEWLGGLSPHRFKSLIVQQLEPHLANLKAIGFLRSYAIEPKAEGGGYNIVFRPGRQFHQDYELFFRNRHFRQLQFKQTTNEVEYHDPIDVVIAFYERLSGAHRTIESIDKGDVDYARELITKHGKDGVIALIEFAIAGAKKTKFAMQTFRALKVYEPAFVPQREALLQAKESERLRSQADLERQLQMAYEEHIKSHAIQYLASLSDDERATLTARAEAEISSTATDPRYISFGVKVRLRSLALEVCPPLSYKEWVARQR